MSISNSDRAPGLNYLGTVYNGIDLSLYPLQERGGDDLVFLGRIHPDKGVHLAIAVARATGMPLLIAGIVQDEDTSASRSSRNWTTPSATSVRWTWRANASCSRAHERCCT